MGCMCNAAQCAYLGALKMFYRSESFGIVCVCYVCCFVDRLSVAWITVLLGTFSNSHLSLISMETLYPIHVYMCVRALLVEIPLQHFNKLKC